MTYGVSYETNMRLCKAKKKVTECVELLLILTFFFFAGGICGTMDYETEKQIPPQESVFASFYGF